MRVLISKCVSSSTEGNLIFIAYCSPSKPTPYMSCISATVDENLSHQPNKMERRGFRFSFRQRASSVDRSYLVDKSFLLYPSVCGLNSLKCIGERYSGMKRQIPTDGGKLIGIERAFRFGGSEGFWIHQDGYCVRDDPQNAAGDANSSEVHVTPDPNCRLALCSFSDHMKHSFSRKS